MLRKVLAGWLSSCALSPADMVTGDHFYARLFCNLAVSGCDETLIRVNRKHRIEQPQELDDGPVGRGWTRCTVRAMRQQPKAATFTTLRTNTPECALSLSLPQKARPYRKTPVPPCTAASARNEARLPMRPRRRCWTAVDLGSNERA